MQLNKRKAIYIFGGDNWLFIVESREIQKHSKLSKNSTRTFRETALTRYNHVKHCDRVLVGVLFYFSATFSLVYSLHPPSTFPFYLIYFYNFPCFILPAYESEHERKPLQAHSCESLVCAPVSHGDCRPSPESVLRILMRGFYVSVNCLLFKFKKPP